MIQEEVLNATSSDMAITPVIKGKVANALLSYETKSKTVTSTYNGETIDQIPLGTYVIFCQNFNGWFLVCQLQWKTGICLKQIFGLNWLGYAVWQCTCGENKLKAKSAIPNGKADFALWVFTDMCEK